MTMSEHTSKQFDAELEAVRARVLQMGGLVESRSAWPSTRSPPAIWS